jgi:hypothetical protein
MTTLTTKTWFEDGKIMEQNIPETEIYKREWAGGLMTDNFHYDLGYEDGWNSAHEERREWVGLTGEEIRLDAHNADSGDWNDDRYQKFWHEGFKEGARGAESMLKEKNT